MLSLIKSIKKEKETSNIVTWKEEVIFFSPAKDENAILIDKNLNEIDIQLSSLGSNSFVFNGLFFAQSYLEKSINVYKIEERSLIKKLQRNFILTVKFCTKEGIVLQEKIDNSYQFDLINSKNEIVELGSFDKLSMKYRSMYLEGYYIVCGEDEIMVFDSNEDIKTKYSYSQYFLYKDLLTGLYKQGGFFEQFIVNSKLILQFRNKILCLNLETGDKLWDWELPVEYDSMLCKLLVDDEKYIWVLTRMHHFYCLDLETGGIIKTFRPNFEYKFPHPKKPKQIMKITPATDATSMVQDKTHIYFLFKGERMLCALNKKTNKLDYYDFVTTDKGTLTPYDPILINEHLYILVRYEDKCVLQIWNTH